MAEYGKFATVLQLVSQTVLVLVISTIHPWLAAGVPKAVRERAQKNIYIVSIFAFAFAYSMTSNIGHATIITVLFFFLRHALRVHFELNKRR